MRYVIVYDIVDDKRRARVARLLESVGERVQWSVFEADWDEATLARVRERLGRLIDPAADGVRIYRLCGECARQTQMLGQSRPVEPPGLLVI